MSAKSSDIAQYQNIRFTFRRYTNQTPQRPTILTLIQKVFPMNSEDAGEVLYFLEYM
jgi:hypothetical protein